MGAKVGVGWGGGRNPPFEHSYSCVSWWSAKVGVGWGGGRNPPLWTVISVPHAGAPKCGGELGGCWQPPFVDSYSCVPYMGAKYVGGVGVATPLVDSYSCVSCRGAKVGGRLGGWSQPPFVDSYSRVSCRSTKVGGGLGGWSQPPFVDSYSCVSCRSAKAGGGSWVYGRNPPLWTVIPVSHRWAPRWVGWGLQPPLWTVVPVSHAGAPKWGEVGWVVAAPFVDSYSRVSCRSAKVGWGWVGGRNPPLWTVIPVSHAGAPKRVGGVGCMVATPLCGQLFLCPIDGRQGGWGGGCNPPCGQLFLCLMQGRQSGGRLGGSSQPPFVDSYSRVSCRSDTVGGGELGGWTQHPFVGSYSCVSGRSAKMGGSWVGGRKSPPLPPPLCGQLFLCLMQGRQSGGGELGGWSLPLFVDNYSRVSCRSDKVFGQLGG